MTELRFQRLIDSVHQELLLTLRLVVRSILILPGLIRFGKYIVKNGFSGQDPAQQALYGLQQTSLFWLFLLSFSIPLQ